MVKPPKKKSKSSNITSSSTAEEQEANVKQLSRTLGISEEQVRAMLAAQGAGLPTATASGRTSRRSTDRKSTGSVASAAASTSAAAANPWSDFMEDEMPDTAAGKKKKYQMETRLRPEMLITKSRRHRLSSLRQYLLHVSTYCQFNVWLMRLVCWLRRGRSIQQLLVEIS